MAKVITPLACVLLAFLFCQSMYAQYSSEAFELKKASDLYDERGYGESSSITVDGSLAISNATGVPSYIYPISHHTISGFPLDVSLTFAGSVSFTTFNTYLQGGAPGFNWSKFQQNRPAWILGVNGFAIQVLHNALSFHCNPAVDVDFQNPDNDEFDDGQFVWMIDGYNFCNAMTNFADQGAAQESQFVDVIRLLRSDGSVLELINPVSAVTNSPNDPDVFTGYYAVNEANAQGYAIVEFDDEYWPDHVQASAGLDPAADNSSAYYIRPRKVRYFPGDGLEYIFREWLMPYGSFSYNGNEGQNQWRYGLPGYTPSIFYLDELRSPAGRLTSFRRSKHYPPEIWKKILGKEEDPTFEYKDSTRGRALITSFDGHEIEYLDNGMIVNALGRTTKIEFHKVSVEGSNLERDNGEENAIGNMHLADYGYAFNPRTGALNPVPAVYATRPDNGFADGVSDSRDDPKFRSYLGMVTRIIDPEGRITRFDYDAMQREYKKYRFPRAEADADGFDPVLRLENPRLVSITEPTAKYDLCYQVQSDLLLLDPADYLSCEYEGVGTPMVTVHRPGAGEDYDPYRMNDVVHHVGKTFCGEMLSRMEYDFTFGIDQEGGQFTESSIVDVYDYKDNEPISLQRTGTDFYRSTYLDNAVPGLPRRRFTGVLHTQESSIEIDGIAVNGSPILGDVILETDTHIEYPPDPETYFGHEYVVLPISQTLYVNNKQKSDNDLRYQFETVRDYYDAGGNLLTDRTATFGTGIKEKEEVLRDGGQDVLVKKTDYLNIKYDPDVLASRPCGELDKLTTLKNYYLEYPENKESDPEWEEMMYDPSIAVYLDGDDAGPVPPVFGLPEEVAMLVPDPVPGDPGNRRYLGGQKFIYGTPEETEVGGDIEGQTELIGRLLKEQQVPEDDPNGVDAVTLQEYEYLRMQGEDCRLVPFRTTNANGAVTEMSYKVTDQNTDPGSPAFDWPTLALLHNNDEVTTHDFNPPLFFSLQFEKPLELESRVRKMVPNSPGTTMIPGEEELKTFNHPTYYGLTQGTVDANGWYSRFDYDGNGRIRRAILPYDYQASGAVPYTGIEEVPLIGGTGKTTTKMNLVCDGTQASYSTPSTEAEIIGSNRITASWWKYPKLPESACPCISGQEKEEGPSVQETCDKTISFTTEEKTIGSLTYKIEADNPSTPEDETSPILLAQTLSDAQLRLVLAETQGECVILRVTCPELGLDYRRTFGQCKWFDDRENIPDASGTKEKEDGGNAVQNALDPGCQAETDVLEETKGLVVDIPLSTGHLLDVTANTILNFRFQVYTPNSSVSFAQTSVDSRPRLVLNGTFSNTRKDDVDYTLLVEYDDRNLKSQFKSKIDDYLHTSNTYVPVPGNPAAFNGTAADAFAEPYRRASAQHRFGADYRILETEELLKDWDNTLLSSPSIVTYDYTGNGLVLEVVDQAGNATSTEYDPAGRASATMLPGIDIYEDLNNDANDDNPGVEVDGGVESKYFVDNDNLNNTASGTGEYDPGSFGVVDLSDQDFYQDYSEVTVNIDEKGIKSSLIKDALGNLRREVFAAYGGVTPYRWVKYDYDALNRLTKVTNAEHQVTEYSYDRFGRVQYKSQQDMGVSSYAYDRLGNVRYTQTEDQSAEERLTFYQYDDLNRLTLVGEAKFLPDHVNSIESDGKEADPEKSGDVLPRLSSGGSLNRLTDQLAESTHYLHINPGDGHPLTYNPSLWDNFVNAGLQPPRVKDIPFSVETACMLSGTSYDESAPMPPYLMAPVTNYDPIPVPNGMSPTLYDFENAARYPNHTRMVIQYDELPALHGAVWSAFPSHAQWNQLVPPRPDWFDEDNNPNTTEIQKVRNTRGREVAVAYREHSGEPYHYTVSSYDPRGRVEAIIHYTENVGFDAVYYEYNSMNLITKVRTVDPFRQHTTWYGYDNNGRLDSVWTKLSDAGTGLAGPAGAGYPYLATPKYPNFEETRPNAGQVDIAYSYDQRGRVATKWVQADPVSPGVNITVDYNYNDRGWLEDMTAIRNGTNLFSMNLEYDQAGQILKQTSQQSTFTANKQHYEYDDVRQLTKWIRNKNTAGVATETYLYDNIGNRENRSHSSTGAMTMSYPKNGCSPNPGDPNYCGDIVGPNRLSQTQTFNGMGGLQYTNYYTYDLNGAIATNTRITPNGSKNESFNHSYRSLLWKYAVATTTGSNNSTFDWRYRYNPRGEREQRRLYSRTPQTDAYSPYPWTYYLLDGRNLQLALWGGVQTSKPSTCAGANPPPPTGSWRYMYPSEYLTYGLGSAADIITRPNGTPNGVKEFKITDHLGSTRVAIKQSGSTQRWDYEPYGDPVAGMPPRKGFIDKEVDKESDLGDFGVRKYDDEIGRFLSTDPLWENYRAWTPYQYSLNNPINITDPSGQSGEAVIEKDADGNETGTVIVYMNFTFYGDGTKKEEFKDGQALAKALEAVWDAPGATVEINGKKYKVDFQFSGKIVDDDANLKKTISSNTSITENFVRLTNDKLNARTGAMSGTASTPGKEGGNAGVWYTGQGIVDNMTGAHEISHMLGLSHWTSGWTGGTEADVRYTTSAVGGKSYLRVVTEEAVKSIFIGIAFNESGIAMIGHRSNLYILDSSTQAK